MCSRTVLGSIISPLHQQANVDVRVQLAAGTGMKRILSKELDETIEGKFHSNSHFHLFSVSDQESF